MERPGRGVIDEDGRGLYSTGLGHGDALHLSDLDPARPGLEVFDIQERFDDAGAHFRDARTGKILWKKPSVKAGEDGEGPGRGLCLDIDPRRPGFECWVRGADITGLFDARGGLISKTTPRSCNFGVYRDGDTLSELLDRDYVSKWNWADATETVLLTAELSVAWQNVGYNQPPHTSFFVGEGMKRPPRPNIVEVHVRK